MGESDIAVDALDEEAARHELGSSHAFLPCLSDKVDIEYHPSRGRFGVANT